MHIEGELRCHERQGNREHDAKSFFWYAHCCDGCVAELMAIIAEDHHDWRDAQIQRLSKIGT